MAIRVLIVDDHGVLRAGLTTLLNAAEDLEVVGGAASAAEASRLAGSLQPDLALVDISLPDGDGIAVTAALKAENPDLKVLVLTAHEEPALVQKAVQAGASGYVVKRAAEGELLDAIRAAMRGEVYLDPTMVRAFISPGAAAGRELVKPDMDLLTRREVEVLRLIAEGFTNNQIADTLVVSPRTVESHRNNIVGKLNLRSRAELVRYARDHGLLDAPVSSPRTSIGV